MNIGTARIVIIVALVVGGIAILWKGFGDASGALPDGGGGGPTGSETGPTGPSGPTGTDTASPSPRETPSPQNPQDVLFQVFNGTNETGLAGQVQQLLEDDNYVAAAEAADAPTPSVAHTVVYYRGGPSGAQNKSDATYLAETYFDGAKVKRLSPDVADVAESANVAIVLGLDYVEAHPTG